MYDLLANCDCPLAGDSLISLLAPGDNLFKIDDKDRKILVEYLTIANFGDILIKSIENFKVFDIAIEKNRVAQD